MNIIKDLLNNTKNKQLRRSWIDVIKYLIIHHTAWSYPWDYNMLNWNNKNSKVSIHYYIRKTWQIYQFVWEEYIAYHCWNSNIWPIENVNGWWWNLNPLSIWIELENLWNWKDVYTDIQIQSLIELTLDIIKRNNIKVENILWHKEITTNKIDISPNFYYWDMAWFRTNIKNMVNNETNNNWEYDNITWYKLYNDLNDNYEIKRLIEIWLYRYDELKEQWKLTIR